MAEVFWKIDNVVMPTPSTWEWSLQDVSSGESGRTSNAIMQKNRVAQKRKLAVAYNGPDAATCATVLQAINPEYISVYYFDLMAGEYQTRSFYVGDRSAPFKIWTIGNRRIERLSFDLIER